MWIGHVGIADVFWHQDRLIIGDRNAHRALTVITIIVSLKMYYFNKYTKNKQKKKTLVLITLSLLTSNTDLYYFDKSR